MKDGLGTFESLVTIVERLRSPGGCPWDREQTHGSLKRDPTRGVLRGAGGYR